MAERRFALQDWLQDLEGDYISQEKELLAALAELKRQEEIERDQALLDLMSGGLPLADARSAGSILELGQLDQRNVKIAELQAKADIATSYAEQRASLADEQQNAWDNYVQQRSKISALLSGGGLTELANRKIQTRAGTEKTEKFVPEDQGLRNDIERVDVPQPDGSSVPTFVQKAKQVREEDVRPAELASFLGLPEDVVRTQMLQERILAAGSLEKAHAKARDDLIRLSKDMTDPTLRDAASSSAQPGSIEEKAIKIGEAMELASLATQEEKDRKKADAKFSQYLFQNERIKEMVAAGELDIEEVRKIAKTGRQLFGLIGAERLSGTKQTKPDALRSEAGRLGALIGAIPIEDIGLGQSSRDALNEAVSQVAGGVQSQAPETAPFESTRAPSGVPYPNPQNPFEDPLQTLFDWLGFIPKDPRVREELARMFGF